MSNNNPYDNKQGGEQPKMPRFNMNWIYIIMLAGLALEKLWGPAV